MNKRPTSKFFRLMMTSLQLLALGLVCEGLVLSTAFATTMTSLYDSNDDLDLNGIFHSAVNFGGTVDVVINDATFKPIPLPTGGNTMSVGPINNVTVGSLTGRVRDPNGPISPTFPAGNMNLQTISETIALTDTQFTFVSTTMAIEVAGLSTGQPYKLQLLFFDVFQNFLGGPPFTNKRRFDIVIEGVTEITDFDIVALTGSGGTFGAVVTHSFTSVDGALDIQLIPKFTPPNFSPLISALTVEIVPEPGTILLLGTGLAGLVAWRMRKGRA